MTDKSLPHHELGQVLMLAIRDFQQRLDQDLKCRGVSGINPRQQEIILHLARSGACRSVDLAEAAGIRPQSMMKIVHELEDMGLLERRPDPQDSRAKLVDFSEQGRIFIGELTASTLTVWQQYRSTIDEAELEQALLVLRQLPNAPRQEQSS